MPGEVILDVVCGNVNSQQGSGKAYVFHSPIASSPRAGCKETYLTTAIKESSSLGSVVSCSRGPARRNVLSDIGGQITIMQVTVKEGEILKVFGQRKAAGWNGVMRTAAVFLRVRRGAALTRLHIRVPDGIVDVNHTWGVTGRFEVVDSSVAEGYGVKIPKMCAGHYSKAGFDFMFRVEELAPEVSAAPIEGTKVVGDKVMLVRRTKRAFDIGE